MGTSDNNFHRTASPTAGELVVPSLAPRKQAREPAESSGVMDTLLGKNNLVALDESGRDPYNATGRHFRR
jgi:hypothetical protein